MGGSPRPRGERSEPTGRRRGGVRPPCSAQRKTEHPMALSPLHTGIGTTPAPPSPPAPRRSPHLLLEVARGTPHLLTAPARGWSSLPLAPAIRSPTRESHLNAGARGGIRSVYSQGGPIAMFEVSAAFRSLARRSYCRVWRLRSAPCTRKAGLTPGAASALRPESPLHGAIGTPLFPLTLHFVPLRSGKGAPTSSRLHPL